MSKLADELLKEMFRYGSGEVLLVTSISEATHLHAEGITDDAGRVITPHGVINVLSHYSANRAPDKAITVLAGGE